jgi:formylglycine-generating enzyme required for sulfatase activity
MLRKSAINVSYEDAVAYAEWLSEQTGKRFRLPSEAEWEYAARAGTRTRRFWGDAPSQACKYANVFDKRNQKKLSVRYGISGPHDCEDPYPETAPVGSFDPNPWGLYDMLGNVWEWVQDCYHNSYEGAPADGSAWEEDKCDRRVHRGGPWRLRPKHVRSAHRHGNEPDTRLTPLGFVSPKTSISPFLFILLPFCAVIAGPRAASSWSILLAPSPSGRG